MNQINAVVQEVNKAIIGKREIVEKVWMAILAGGNVLLEDVPGVGKTTMALAFKKALGMEYKRIQFTPDTMPSDIIGFSVYDKNAGVLEYKQGAIMTNLLLADEINRTSAKTQASLLEAMEEGNVTVDGITHELPKPFHVIATQNPVGAAGTQLLPDSQLDRFLVRLKMGYPDKKSEINILRGLSEEEPLEKVEQVASLKDLVHMQEEAGKIYTSDHILTYITELADATRNHKMVTLGLSTRGSLAVCRMAKAHAYYQGRDYVSPEDVKVIFADVAAHRLNLSIEAKVESKTAYDIVEDILQKTEVLQ